MSEFDAGLMNIETLRERLLDKEGRDPSAVIQARWNPVLIATGLGVTARFEEFCGRKLTRGVSVTETFPGGRDFFVVQHYPIETITSVQLQTEVDGTKTDATIKQQFNDAGIIYTEGDVGTDATDLVEIVVTGGYWHDTTEDSSGTLPTGATEVPEDLKTAFVLQMRHLCLAEYLMQGTEKHGQDLRSNSLGGKVMATEQSELLPDVKAVLQRYVKRA